MSLSQLGLFPLTVAVLVVSLLVRSKKKNALPLPPGPKKLPLIGNLLDLPLENFPQTYAHWSKMTGSGIVHADALGKNFIIINDSNIAYDLFEKRGHIYSCRMGMSCIFAVMPYGDEWKDHRRTFVQYFPQSNPAIHQPKEVQLVRTQLLPHLLDSPEKFMGHIRHFTGGLLIQLAYGMDTMPANDPWIQLAEQAMLASASAAVPGKWLVDIFPSLKHVPEWFPGAGFKTQAREWKDLWTKFRTKFFLAGEENIAKGCGQKSFLSSSLDHIDEKGDIKAQKNVIQDTAATFLAAGADTTGATIVNFILAMTLFPEVQNKAQVEIDALLENGRLPEFADMESLPYVTALTKEVLRWQPANPLGIPHLLTKDDTYNGYHIPKGSFVIGNGWAMSRDEHRYPEPDLFKPERYLTPDGKLDPDCTCDPETFVFGFGRRKCVGSHIGVSTAWMTIASILATFKISKAKDESGNIIEPVVDFRSAAIVALPSPFKCSITPRSNETEKLIYAAAEHDS
ncbi:hypothetical protein AGABI2DRAFT_208721 [Agaricus bisporus var. bisporus H97]|uniref:hypothetical protein n=1 Tax=Agaricus bisporus var. bisporus (strain H97 / ATCC MYA-4626 / FGSC 10389) TaxID=936046 RepID=UPI00029F6348|nr:hypothetical protein AGABI2DRAFT_208721 [Agaricus bisporus var. bisporus H97]EKV44479.1 hypothetical protein AGABI2DRAFT_208721 [Agaricus bisporus var. bisporus H97]